MATYFDNINISVSSSTSYLYLSFVIFRMFTLFQPVTSETCFISNSASEGVKYVHSYVSINLKKYRLLWKVEQFVTFCSSTLSVFSCNCSKKRFEFGSFSWFYIGTFEVRILFVKFETFEYTETTSHCFLIAYIGILSCFQFINILHIQYCGRRK